MRTDRQTERHGEVNRCIFGNFRSNSAKHVLKICSDPIFRKSSTITTKYDGPFPLGPPYAFVKRRQR